MTDRLRRGPKRLYINGSKIKDRLIELGMSERHLALASGLSVPAVTTAITEDTFPARANVGDLYRMLEELGYDPGEVLDPEPVEAQDDASADVQLLAQVLTREPYSVSADRLALALEWTTRRVRAAQRALDMRLNPLGLKVSDNTVSLTIRQLDGRADDAVIRLAELRDDKSGLHPNAARVLYAVYAGRLGAQALKGTQQIWFGTLKNRGAITYGRGRRMRVSLSKETRFAFPVDEE